MLFNSLQFLIFFPITVILYFFLPLRFRLFFLFLASCIFYLAGTPWYIAVIFLSILVDYIAALIITNSKGRKRTTFLFISLLTNIGLLMFFKYFNFVNQNISLIALLFGIHINPLVVTIGLPLGLSFHTFQGMSYVIEVYKKRYKPEKNILRYALFVMFFPQIASGPIERPQQLLKQFSEIVTFDYTQAKNGIRLMLWGMLKKVAVADRIAIFVDPIFAHPSGYSSLSLIMATVLFAFQIYYDFSGYIDIARGAAAVLGYRLELNFNNPYTSTSVQDFWRRWNITLSLWFRDYVYIPLGGNRGSLLQTIKNLFITFLLCGLWHGAAWHYVFWGALNGLYLSICHIKSSISRLKNIVFPNYISIPFTFICVCIGWIFFRAQSINDALNMIKTIFSPTHSHTPIGSILSSIILTQSKTEFFLVLIFILIVEYIQIHKNKIMQIFIRTPLIFRWAIYSLLLWIIILAGEFGNTSFIYYSF